MLERLSIGSNGKPSDGRAVSRCLLTVPLFSLYLHVVRGGQAISQLRVYGLAKAATSIQADVLKSIDSR